MSTQIYRNYAELVDSFKSSYKSELPALTLADTGVTLSYHQLYKKINFFYEKLVGINLGDRVLIHNVNPLDWAALYFAIILKGAVVVPLDTRVSLEFMDEVVKSLEPKLRISNSLENFLLRDSVSIDLPFTSDENCLAQVIFTSGTWSIPKGVMLSQKNILTNAYQVLDIYKHKKEDTSLCILPLSHTYQHTVGFILPLIVGSHVIFLENIDSVKLVNTIKKYKVETMLVAPKVLQLIRSSILRKISNSKTRNLFEKIALKANLLPLFCRYFIFKYVRSQIGVSLKNLIVGGALLSADLDNFFTGLGYNIVVGYGLSETAPVISVSKQKRYSEGDVGKIVKGLNYQINELGELLVGGDNLFLGYWPEFKFDQYFNTKDVAGLSKKGNLIIKGRTKDLIIYPSGDKIFTEDLEYLIKKHHEFDEVCIVHKTDNGNIEVYCAVKHHQNLDTDKILKEIHTKIPQVVKIHKLKFFYNNDFPYTHTLKPNKKKILEIFTS